jgi:hypothetical protein
MLKVEYVTIGYEYDLATNDRTIVVNSYINIKINIKISPQIRTLCIYIVDALAITAAFM